MSVFAQVRRLSVIEAIPSRGARRGLAVLAFAGATALGAYVSVPVPGSFVPVSLQTLMVVLSGLLLGPWLGAASQVTYLALGAAGAPVFAGGIAGFVALLGPTGGYLVAFPLAAFAAGAVAGGARRGWAADARLLLAATFAGLLVLLFGSMRLGNFVGSEQAFRAGVLPFLYGDALKTLVAFVAARRVRARTLGQL